MKKFIPLLLFALVAFCGCEEEPQQYYLSDAVKPLFCKGDTFYYYSVQTKLTDTVVVSDLHYGFREESGEKKIADSYEYAEVSYDFINKKDMSVSYKQFGDVYYYKKYGNEDSPILTCKIGKSLTEYTNYNFIGENDYKLIYREKKEIEIVGRKITVLELLPSDMEENVTIDFPQSIYFTAQNGILGYAYSDSVEYLIVNPKF